MNYNKLLISNRLLNTEAEKFGIDRKILIQVNRLERRKRFRRNSVILIPNKNAIE